MYSYSATRLPLTGMYSYPQHERVLRPVPDGELADGLQQVERHGGHLAGVLQPVPHRQTAHLHTARQHGVTSEGARRDVRGDTA